MAVDDEDSDVPETGAVFTFGKCKFNDNFPGKFWLRDDRVVCVSCGDEHTTIVSESGKLFTFGDNMWGQLGLGHCKAVKKPTRVKALLEEKVVKVACGRSHTVVTTASGNLYTFGANDEGQLGFDSNGEERISVPTQITLPPKAGRIKQLAAGVYHSACLTETGDMYVWGQGSEGQLGLGMDTIKQSTPVAVPFDDSISHIACGYYHTVIVTKSGSLYSCGEMDNGKLGCPSDSDIDHFSLQRVTIHDKVTAVSCGHNHTVALTEKGGVFTFGDGANGQLGHGNKLLESPTPNVIQWNKPTKIVHIACGEGHTALISDRGILYTCGDGLHGKLALGDDNLSNHFKPTPVSRFAKFLVESVSCGGCHTLVIARPRPEGDDGADSLDEPSVSESIDEPLSHNKLSVVGEMIRRGELSNSLDMSGSIAARMRRRQKAPELLTTQSLALPRLKTEQSSPPTTSKQEHRGEKLDNDIGKREKQRHSDSDGSEPEESALSKTMTLSAPLPKPRHMQRFIKRTDDDIEKQPVPLARLKLPPTNKEPLPPTNKEPLPGPADDHQSQDSADSLESGIDESDSDSEGRPANGEEQPEMHEVKPAGLKNLMMAEESADEVSEEEEKQVKVEKLNKEKEKAETSNKKTRKPRLRFFSLKKSDKVMELSDSEADGDKKRTDKGDKKKDKERDSEDEEEVASEDENKPKTVVKKEEKDVKMDKKKNKENESENELKDDDEEEDEKDKKKKKKDKADKKKGKGDVSEEEKDVESETDESPKSDKKKEKDGKKKSAKNKKGEENEVESNGDEATGDEDGSKKKKKDKMKKVKTEVDEEDEDEERKGGKHSGKKKNVKDSKKKKGKGDAEDDEDDDEDGEKKGKGKDKKKKKNSSKKKPEKAKADDDSAMEDDSAEDESASKGSLPNDKKASNKKKVSDKKAEEKDGKKEESKLDAKSEEKSEESKKEEEKAKELEKKNSKFCTIL